MGAYWNNWAEKCPSVSIEDGMAEDDWAGWKALTQSIGGRASAGTAAASSSKETYQGSGYPNAYVIPTPVKASTTPSSRHIQLLGADPFVPNTTRLSRGINEGIAHATLH